MGGWGRKMDVEWKKGHKDILSLKLQTKVTFMADKIFMLYLSADSR